MIVPDFGGFVANYASARINPVSNRFDPPYRQITFNRLLVHNDGLLAAYVAQKENERYEEALKSVREYVVYLKSELQAGKQVEIQKVGILFHQADGTYRFEQVKDSNLFVEGFGLDSFFSKKLGRRGETAGTQTPRAPKAIPVDAPVKPQPEPKVIALSASATVTTPETGIVPVAPVRRRRYWPAVAAAIGIPVIGYTLWISLNTPLFKDNGQFHYSDLNPFAEKVCPVYESRKDTFVATEFEEPALETATGDTGDIALLYNDNAPDKTLVVRLSEPKERNLAIAGHYHIIGGCFSVQENAQGLVETYRKLGDNAAILDKKGGLYRVSIASFATKKEAEVALASYQKNIPGAWLLHK